MAKTVEHFIVRERYVNFYNVQNYTYFRRFLQFQTIAQDNFYTSCGLDMMDTINQRNLYNWTELPIDRVEGYSINQLENALNNATSWDEWRDHVKNNNTNTTSQHLDELFANWTN